MKTEVGVGILGIYIKQIYIFSISKYTSLEIQNEVIHIVVGFITSDIVVLRVSQCTMFWLHCG